MILDGSHNMLVMRIALAQILSQGISALCARVTREKCAGERKARIEVARYLSIACHVGVPNVAKKVPRIRDCPSHF
jgi:hypothetical protein